MGMRGRLPVDKSVEKRAVACQPPKTPGIKLRIHIGGDHGEPQSKTGIPLLPPVKVGQEAHESADRSIGQP